MADQAKPATGNNPNETKPEKTKRIVKPRIPEDHVQVKFNLHKNEAAHLQQMANDSDRETFHDMARASMRQLIKASQAKSQTQQQTA